MSTPATGWRRHRWEQLYDGRLIRPCGGSTCRSRTSDASWLTRMRIRCWPAIATDWIANAAAVARIAEVDRFLEKGIAMPTVQSGARPVQIRLAVDDPAAAVDFYREASGFRYDVARSTSSQDYFGFICGEHGQDDFFLLCLLGPDPSDRPGPANFSLMVEDLDAYHASALAAGCNGGAAPFQAEGMPRFRCRTGPSGNRIGLAQGQSIRRRPTRQISLSAVD